MVEMVTTLHIGTEFGSDRSDSELDSKVQKINELFESYGFRQPSVSRRLGLNGLELLEISAIKKINAIAELEEINTEICNVSNMIFQKNHGFKVMNFSIELMPGGS